MTEYINALRHFNRNMRIFLLATAVHAFAFFGIYSLLLNLYLLRLGYGPTFIGVANGIAPLVLAFASLPAGLLSHRIGSRRALILGYLFIAVGFCLLPLAEFLPDTFQESWIVGSYALAWLFAALSVVNSSPYIMAATSKKERTHAFAIHSVLFPLFGFLGNLVGGFLPTFFGNMAGVNLESPLPYRNALLVGGSLYLLAALLMWCATEVVVVQTHDEAGTQHKTVSKPVSTPIKLIGVVALISFLIVVGSWTIQLYLNVYLDAVLSVPTSLIGSLSAIARLLGLSALMAPLAIARLGKKRTLLWAMLALAVGFLPVILISHWTAVGLSFMIIVAFGSLVNPTFRVFSQSSVAPQWRTTIASAIAMTTGMAIALTALGGSAVIVAFGFRALFFIGAASILLAAVVFSVYFTSRPQPIGKSVAERVA